MKKKITILVFCMLVVLAIVIPIIVTANKNQNWKQVELSDNGISNNEATSLSLFDEENYVREDIPIENISTEEYQNNEISEEDRKQYEKWAKEGEEYREKGRVVNELLAEYYPDEFNKIQKEIDEINTNGLNTITLKQYEVDKADLVVKLYNEHKLDKSEKEACKIVLYTYYKTPEGDIKMSDDLKKEIEKIIK